MAVKNRTEAITQVDSKIVATVTNVTHRDLLNNDILNSVDFRKDVIASETPVAGSVTINYLNKDLATVTTAVNLSVSFTNIENGDVKYLHITKAAANTVSFSGALDVSPRKAYINTTPTIVIYQVSNKNNVILVNSINIDNDISADLALISGGIYTKVLALPAWNMQSSNVAGVAHGIADYKKIVSCQVIIRNDVNNLNTDLVGGDAQLLPTTLSGGWDISATLVLCWRPNTSTYANSNFSSVAFSRGYAVIRYLP